MNYPEKRKSPSVPPMNKGTLMPTGLPYKVMGYIKDCGPASRRDLEREFPGVPAMTLRNALDSLRKSGRIFVHGWERGQGTRCLTLYSDRRPEKRRPEPLPPLTPAERSLAHKRAKRQRVASVFEWRGQVQFGNGAKT